MSDMGLSYPSEMANISNIGIGISDYVFKVSDTI